MNKLTLFLFLHLISINGTIGSHLKNSFLSNSSNSEDIFHGNSTGNALKIHYIAGLLKSILNTEELIYLARLIAPINSRLESDGHLEEHWPSNNVSRNVYYEMTSLNLTGIPTYELLDVPELLPNATHLREIRNIIRSPRPIRPRRKFRCRNPSNIPGASPIVVCEKAIVTCSTRHDD
ncbi:hypothetical protein HWI79_1536 [Cryptosporidium felis]|nr:hypothetical protein HWI79_1536 [Cryptosporidium felis]